MRRQVIFFLMVLFGMSCQSREDSYRTWQVYKGDQTSSSYSRLDQINKDNVTQLEVAWTYRTGDLTGDFPRAGIETNPIIVDGARGDQWSIGTRGTTNEFCLRPAHGYMP